MSGAWRGFGGINRRRAARVKHLTLVRFCVVSGSNPRRRSGVHQCYGEDLSVTGIRLRLPDSKFDELHVVYDFEKERGHNSLELDFLLPPKDTVRVRGVATWHTVTRDKKGFLVGVRFTEITPDDAQKIEAFVGQKSRPSSG